MHQPLRILLIEDDESFAILISRVLKKLGHKHYVRHVVRLGEAIEELNHRVFDVVLTDLTLPDAVRLDAVEKIRKHSPNIPLIVLTMLESSELISAAVQIGAQDFIVKDTVTPPLLERAIQNAVERQKMVAEKAQLIATLQAQQETLNQKNAKLKQLVETTHRFADNVSHEFRTPLTVIREYAALVREGLLGEVNQQQSEFMDVIVYRVDDLNRMVDDMLDSSKLEAGIMGTHRAPTNPLEIIEAPLTGLRLKAQVRGVELSHDLPTDLPRVCCDVEKAGRVITNLAANAIKFTDDGAGRVHISAKYLAEDGDVEFSVSDNGPGINPDDLKRMFNRFQQLGTSTQSSTKGFGLGLNIARELVDLNYGQMRVESQLGEGTTFYFTVPVDDWSEIVRRYCKRLAATSRLSSVVVVSVQTDQNVTEAGMRDMDAFWRFTQRQTDLIRRTGEREWKLLIACCPDELEHVIDRFKSEHTEVSRSRPRPLPELTFETLGCFACSETLSVLEVANESQECLELMAT